MKTFTEKKRKKEAELLNIFMFLIAHWKSSFLVDENETK